MRVLVVGLDCAEPSLVLDRWRDELPTLRRLMDGGTYGELTSTIPAMTVPSWAAMMSGKDPGQLGFYDFRNRADYSYEAMTIATGQAVKADRVWDIASRAGKQTITVSVPQTYPVKPVNGAMIGCFLTPSTRSPYTYPPELKQEIERLIGGEYMVDVPQFRTGDHDFLLAQIYQMADQHHTVVKHLLATRPWDFFMHVDMGVDRIHHGMWRFTDPLHPRYEPGNPYENVIHDYYIHIDRQIGEWLELVGWPPKDTAVLVVSDHGAQPIMGGICINEWLKREGYLVLEHQPDGIVPLEKCEVDWSRTRAWAAGGYYARVYLNVAGREPEGIVAPADYEGLRDELAAGIAAICETDGQSLGSVSFKPQEIYREINNIPPDLIAYLGKMAWRSVASLGWDGIYSTEKDAAPDDASHAQQGLYIYYNPAVEAQGRAGRRRVVDIAPTVLDLLDLPIPGDMRGESFAQ